MKQRNQIFYSVIAFLLFLCLFSGCSSGVEIPDSEKKLGKFFSFATYFGQLGSCAMSGEGVYVFQYYGNNTRHMVLTFEPENAVSTVVCWNPGCTHNREKDPGCPAIFGPGGYHVVAGGSSDKVYVLSQERESTIDDGKSKQLIHMTITEIDLENRSRREFWTYTYDLGPLVQTNNVLFAVFQNELYTLRSISPLPNYAAGEYGSEVSEGSLSASVIEKISLSTGKSREICRTTGDISEIWPIGITKDYLLMTELDYATESRQLQRVSLKTGNKEIVCETEKDVGCCFLNDNEFIYAKTQGGRTEFFRKNMETAEVNSLGSIDGEYGIQYWGSFQMGLSNTGLIRIAPMDALFGMEYLFYDWKDGCLRQQQGYALEEKNYDDQRITIEVRSLYDAEDIKIYSFDFAEAHEGITEMLPRVE